MTEPANDNSFYQWEDCWNDDVWDNVGSLCVSTTCKGPNAFPYFFETLIFNMDTGETVGAPRQYTIWKKAEAGHRAAVLWAKHNRARFSRNE